jgi:protein O-mannosyl-transferase
MNKKNINKIYSNRNQEKNISSLTMFFEGSENNKILKIIICIFIILATFSIYSQVQYHEFINYDDDIYITNNLNVQTGFTSESLEWAITNFITGNWSPVIWFSHMLDYQLYGLQPKGHHFTSLSFHISNSLLLFFVIFRMTGGIWKSSFVATMFALHPLNVESVAWAAERKNVLSTFFMFLTMLSYIRYADKPTFKRYCLVFLFFSLGLMTKPMLVTLPFVLLLLDYWPLARLNFDHNTYDLSISEKYPSKYSLVLEKIPLFLISVAISIVTFIAQKSSGAMNFTENLTFALRLSNAMVSYLEYLEKMFWPHKLSIFYPHPVTALSLWQGIFCGLSLLAITIISIRLIRRAPYFIVGWFWFLGTMVPVSGIVQVGGQSMADRYAYIPIIGIFIIIAWGVPELISKWRHKEKVLPISAGIIVFIFMILTWKQVSYWKNSITIFNHSIRVTDNKYPGFALVYNNLGLSQLANNNNDDAIFNFKRAIMLNPKFPAAYSNLGNVMVSEGMYDEAISLYITSIKIKPDYADAYNNLGNALHAKGKYEQAILVFNNAIKIKSDFYQAYNNLGNALLAERMYEEAISMYKFSIKLNPDYSEAHYNLGNALSAITMNVEAVSHYKAAIKINPEHALAYNNLGVSLLEQNMDEEAINYFQAATRIRPGFLEAQKNLEIVLFRLKHLK